MSEYKIDNVLTLGALVKTARKNSNLTQVEAAALCGVGVRFLSDLENGKSTVEFSKTLQVMRGLGLELMVKHRNWK